MIGHDSSRRGRQGQFRRARGREHGEIALRRPSPRRRLLSSSAIRSALDEGDGRPPTPPRLPLVRQRGRHGDKRGRARLPTANLALGEGLPLAARHLRRSAPGRGPRVRDGVAGFGRRPTFDNGAPLLEVHLFDYDGDLYGPKPPRRVRRVNPREERFASAEALVARCTRTPAKPTKGFSTARRRASIHSWWDERR